MEFRATVRRMRNCSNSKGNEEREQEMTEQTTKQEVLGSHADDEYLTADELDGLELEPMSESGAPCSTGEMREEGWIFRLTSDENEVSGYLVESMDSTPSGSILHYLGDAPWLDLPGAGDGG